MSKTAQKHDQDAELGPKATSARVPLVFLVSSARSRSSSLNKSFFWPDPPMACDPEDVAILMQAFGEARAFFQDKLTPAQRREMASAILSHARRGLMDPHRLAIKAIVAV